VKPFCISLCLFSIMFLFGARLTAAAPAGNAKPSITITSPRDGATIVGSNVTIHVSVANFKLVPPVILSPANWKSIPLLRGNQGHIHYVLDNVAFMVLRRDITVQTSHTWTNVAPGRHTLIAYLATSQHAPFPGAQQATIHITVARPGSASSEGAGHRRPTPGIRITQVRSFLSRGVVTVGLRVSTSHFKLVPPVYVNPPNLPGNQGHIHYVLDSINNFNTIRDAVIAQYHPFYGVSPGWHTVMAYLATSQHQHFPGTNIARARVFVRATMVTRRSPVLRLVTLPRPGGGGGDSTGPGLDLLAPVGVALLVGTILALARRLAIAQVR